MTKRKTKKPKTISEAKVRRLAAQLERIAAENFELSRNTEHASECQYWRGRGHIFEYCAIAIRQELLGEEK